MAMISPDCSLLSRVLKSFNPPSFLKLEGLKAPCRPSLVSKIQKKARAHGAYLQRESHQTQPVRTVPERALGDVQGLYFMPTTPISRISTGCGRYNTPTLLHPRLTVGIEAAKPSLQPYNTPPADLSQIVVLLRLASYTCTCTSKLPVLLRRPRAFHLVALPFL